MRLFLAVTAAVALMIGGGCTQAPTVTSGPTVPAASTSGATLVPTTSAAAAIVNGTPIPRAAYQRRLEIQKALIQGFDLRSPQGRAIEAQLAVDTLNQMIDVELLRQAAAARGISVTPAEIDQRLNAPADGEAWAVMRSALSQQSVDPEYFRTLIEQQLLSERMMSAVVTDVPATAEQVRLRRIAIETDEDARAALADLAAGTDFAQIAQTRSIDPESRARGGDVGFYPQGILAPEVEQIAFSLPVGGVSQPLKTPLGYEVIQVVERSPNRPVPPEFQQLIRERRFSEWLKQLRAQASIEYADAKG